MVALQKEQDSTLSPMDRNSARADRFVQSQVNLEKIVETAKPLYGSLDGRAETQVHRAWTHARA